MVVDNALAVVSYSRVLSLLTVATFRRPTKVVKGHGTKIMRIRKCPWGRKKYGWEELQRLLYHWQNNKSKL